MAIKPGPSASAIEEMSGAAGRSELRKHHLLQVEDRTRLSNTRVEWGWRMSSKFTENVEAQIIGTIIGGAILLAPAAIFAGAAPLLAAALGPTASYLIELLLGSATFLFTVVAGHYYFLVLPSAKEPAGTAGRKHYDALQNDLATGGTAARVYSEKLEAALRAVDSFFGDAGTPDQRAFLLKTPAPLWTPPAFHRCLLLALLYPIIAIFLIWAVSGDVGPAEAAVGLPPHLPWWWQRSASVLGLAFGVLGYWNFRKNKGRKSLVWLLLTPIGASVIASAVAQGGAGTVAGSVGVSGAIIGAVADDMGVGVSATVIGALTGAIAFAFAGTVAGEVVGALAVVSVGTLMSNIHITRGRDGGSLLMFVLAMFVACFGAAEILSPLPSWPVVGPLLLFLGLFTLLNAPFDWFSLGLTRALLRRGLERQLWWPYFYALLDACCAVVVIALLACTMVIGIQLFDSMAVRGGGTQVLPLDELFQGINTDPLAPKYWWLYALLFSTMIPSLVNLVIGGLALTRGVPQLSAYLHSLMDSGRSQFHRIQIATLLAGQVVIGVALGIAAQAALVWVIFHYAMPLLGVELLNVARFVAALNLPSHVLDLF